MITSKHFIYLDIYLTIYLYIHPPTHPSIHPVQMSMAPLWQAFHLLKPKLKTKTMGKPPQEQTGSGFTAVKASASGRLGMSMGSTLQPKYNYLFMVLLVCVVRIINNTYFSSDYYSVVTSLKTIKYAFRILLFLNIRL